jgi:hypothetical protein
MFFNLIYICIRFYIILQGSVNIYRLDDDNPKPIHISFDTITTFAGLDNDAEQRDELISQSFGNYIVTLGKKNVRYIVEICLIDCEHLKVI